MSADPLVTRAYPGSIWEKVPAALRDFDGQLRENIVSSIHKEEFPWRQLEWLTESPAGIAFGLVLVLTPLVLIRGKPDFNKATYLRALLLVVCGGISDLTSSGLKVFFGRLKPHVNFVNPHPDYLPAFSFPSNHAFNSALIWVLLFFFLNHSFSDPKMRRYMLTVALPIVFVIGLTRVMFGEHYPIDVLGGWIMGSTAGYLLVRLFRKFIPKAFTA